MYFPGGQLLNATMDAQLHAWLLERNEPYTGWALCYSSANGHPKDNPSDWHSRCDGHDRTVVVGTNQHAYVFGGYSDVAWDDGSGWVTEDEGQFIFRLAGPGLGAEAWDDTGSNTNFQLNAAWPSFGGGRDLIFGNGGELGTNHAYCSGPNTYQAATSAVCGGGVGWRTWDLGAWGAAESEMEMWYAR